MGRLYYEVVRRQVGDFSTSEGKPDIVSPAGSSSTPTTLIESTPHQKASPDAVTSLTPAASAPTSPITQSPVASGQPQQSAAQVPPESHQPTSSAPASGGPTLFVTIRGIPTNTQLTATLAPGTPWVVSFIPVLAPIFVADPKHPNQEGGEFLTFSSVPTTSLAPGITAVAIDYISGSFVPTSDAATPSPKGTPIPKELVLSASIVLATIAVPSATGVSGPPSPHPTVSAPVPKSTGSGSSDKGLTTGSIAGIVIAILAIFGLGIFAFMVYTRKYKKQDGMSGVRRRLDRNTESYDSHQAMEEHAIEVYPPGPSSKAMVFDQPKDDDAIKALFENADDMLADHIENYYVPEHGDVSEIDVAQQIQDIPREESMLIDTYHILSQRSKLLKQGKLRGYALRALAAYYLYDAVMDNKFLSVETKREIEQLRSNRQSYTPQKFEEGRLVIFHRFAQSDNYTSSVEACVSRITQRLGTILSPFAINQDTERHANLQNVVRRFAELAVTLGKQPALFKAELEMRDFSNAEVSRAEKEGKERIVRYVRGPFDGSKMELENRDGDVVKGKVRAVVSPGVRKYTVETGKKFTGSEVLRKAKVLVL